MSFCRDQELCEIRGGRPGLHVPNSPCGLCGRKATLNLNEFRDELKPLLLELCFLCRDGSHISQVEYERIQAV